MDTSCPVLSFFCLLRCRILFPRFISILPMLHISSTKTCSSSQVSCQAVYVLHEGGEFHTQAPQLAAAGSEHNLSKHQSCQCFRCCDAVDKAAGLGNSTAGQIFLPHWGVSSALEVQIVQAQFGQPVTRLGYQVPQCLATGTNSSFQTHFLCLTCES